ncbi:hypothetical protein GCM10022280_10070 [Sphingomonas swuensis]|uniref:DUF4893 domain-containing protein n=1 Tax=Sphingomonas swuensis TaxID=977800 RepID=A0ABP7SMA0_9SPHN
MKALLPLAALLVAGCATDNAPLTPPGTTVRAAATDGDRQRLRDWREAFTRGLAEARAAGHQPAILREGALLEPDAALGGPIPNGTYRCRVIKLGARSPGLLPFIAYPRFNCRISTHAGVQHFAKLTGSQRQVGTILPDGVLRSVFLGTLVLGDEQRAMPYGADSERDLAGYVERIGPQRWRLILPYPRFESLIDVIELVPA